MKTYTEKEVIELLKKQAEACAETYVKSVNTSITGNFKAIKNTPLVLQEFSISESIKTLHFNDNRIADILFISHKGFYKLEEEMYSQVHNYLGLDVIITDKLKDYDFKLIKL